MKVDVLITGALIVTMDPGRRVIPGGAIAISGDRIAFVGSEQEAEGTIEPGHTIDARRKAVLPGMIDAHAHGGHTLFKMIGAHLPSSQWLDLIAAVYFNATTPAYWYADGLLAAAERIRAGITCGVMMLGNEPRTDGPAFGEAFASGSAAVGGRTVLSIGPPGPPWPRGVTRWEENRPQRHAATYAECLAVTEALTRKLHPSAEGRIRVMLGPSYMPAGTNDDAPGAEDRRDTGRVADDIRALAERHGTFIHLHAYGGEIQRVFRHYEGFLGPDVLLAHCTGITESEQKLLRQLDIKVAHCPKAHRAYSARCPVPELIDLGVRVAVTSDASAPDRTFDLFEAMRAAQRLQRAHFHDPMLLPPGKMLESVTIDAAEAIGMAGEFGSLEVGKKADLMLVDLWRPHLVPSLVPVWQLVHAATAGDVCDVFVDGRQVVSDGRCVDVREDDVMARATEEAVRMVGRAKIEPLLELPPSGWMQSRLGEGKH